LGRGKGGNAKDWPKRGKKGEIPNGIKKWVASRGENMNRGQTKRLGHDAQTKAKCGGNIPGNPKCTPGITVLNHLRGARLVNLGH